MVEPVVKLVRTYRLTAGFAERLRLAEEIFSLIEPQLRLFVFGSLVPALAEDVLQDILKAIATDLAKFKGDTEKQFWAWCYRIARNKLGDHFRKQASDRTQPMAVDEFWQLVESTAAPEPLSAADRHDLEYAMNLLRNANPECFDFLWQHYVFGLDYGEIAEAENLNYDAVRMKIGRCLETARSLVS
jgi:RNA polymerase sigma factor (sigma-70 family)